MKDLTTSSSGGVLAFAPAKINWTLAILGRRADGYHELDTVFQTVQFGDRLLCRPLPEAECRIECAAEGVPTDERNLIWRAWRALRDACPGKVGGLHVRLDKRVPHGAGLGGGSSDAAATLVALDRIYRLHAGAEKLEAVAATIGSDCPFFVRGGAMRGQGRGERLTPIAARLENLWLIIVHPGFPTSTADAYGAVEPADLGPGRVTETIEALCEGNVGKIENNSTNAFYGVVSRTDSRYNTIRTKIVQHGFSSVRLSGSGSAFWALTDDRHLALNARRDLMRIFPLVVLTTPRQTGIGIRDLSR